MRHLLIGLFSLLASLPLFAGAPENDRAMPAGVFFNHTVQETQVLIVWVGYRLIVMQDGVPIGWLTTDHEQSRITLSLFDGREMEAEWDGSQLSAQTCKCSQLTSSCEPSDCAAISTCGTAQPQSHYCQWYYLTSYEESLIALLADWLD